MCRVGWEPVLLIWILAYAYGMDRSRSHSDSVVPSQEGRRVAAGKGPSNRTGPMSEIRVFQRIQRLQQVSAADGGWGAAVVMTRGSWRRSLHPYTTKDVAIPLIDKDRS